jgi:hypothetical protein
VQSRKIGKRQSLLKLDILSLLGKHERFVDVGRNVRFAHISISTKHNYADRITESDKSGTEAFVWHDCHSPFRMNHTKTMAVGLVHFIPL